MLKGCAKCCSLTTSNRSIMFHTCTTRQLFRLHSDSDALCSIQQSLPSPSFWYYTRPHTPIAAKVASSWSLTRSAAQGQLSPRFTRSSTTLLTTTSSYFSISTISKATPIVQPSINIFRLRSFQLNYCHLFISSPHIYITTIIFFTFYNFNASPKIQLLNSYRSKNISRTRKCLLFCP